jgi:hypothetical protein
MDCFEEDDEDNTDPDCPHNPNVTSADRKLVLELSRKWLLGRQTCKSVIKINPKDDLLTKIKDKVGLVQHSIYIFGLQDRDEYQMSASNNLIAEVRECLLLNGLNYIVIEGAGCNRLGISHSLRENEMPFIIKLIKKITHRHVMTAVNILT